MKVDRSYWKWRCGGASDSSPVTVVVWGSVGPARQGPLRIFNGGLEGEKNITFWRRWTKINEDWKVHGEKE